IVDPVLGHYYHLSPFARQSLSLTIWSAEWRGSIDVPSSGGYSFEAERLSRAGLWIDGQALFDDTGNAATEAHSGAIQRAAGRHEIRVRLQDRGDGGPRLYLYWTPPGATVRQIVPGRVLFPPLPAPD